MKRLAIDLAAILALSLVLLLVVAPALANSAVPAEPADPAAPAETPAYAPGSYTAEAQGFGGTVSVSITVDDSGSISAVAITGDDETDGIGTNAIEQMPDQILAAQSAEVDGVTAATYTSDAIKAALAEALAQAGA